MLTTTRRTRAASCSGLSATTIWMVEQLGLAMIPRCFEDVVRVDLGHDQRNVGLHPEGARVVDDDRAGGRRDRAPLARDGCRRAREDDLDARERTRRLAVGSDGFRRGTSPSCPRSAPRRGT